MKRLDMVSHAVWPWSGPGGGSRRWPRQRQPRQRSSKSSIWASFLMQFVPRARGENREHDRCLLSARRMAKETWRTKGHLGPLVTAPASSTRRCQALGQQGEEQEVPYRTTKLCVCSKPTGRWRPWRSTAIPHLAVAVEGEGQSGPLVGCGAKG
jgi:hypothetical protein